MIWESWLIMGMVSVIVGRVIWVSYLDGLLVKVGSGLEVGSILSVRVNIWMRRMVS